MTYEECKILFSYVTDLCNKCGIFEKVKYARRVNCFSLLSTSSYVCVCIVCAEVNTTNKRCDSDAL